MIFPKMNEEHGMDCHAGKFECFHFYYSFPEFHGNKKTPTAKFVRQPSTGFRFTSAGKAVYRQPPSLIKPLSQNSDLAVKTVRYSFPDPGF
jgi:hypothetical protein